MTMSDIELEILDELYFIKPCTDLLADKIKDGLTQQEVINGLWQLINKGFVRSASLQDGQPHQLPTNEQELLASHLLATKEGLLAIHLG